MAPLRKKAHPQPSQTYVETGGITSHTDNISVNISAYRLIMADQNKQNSVK